MARGMRRGARMTRALAWCAAPVLLTAGLAACAGGGADVGVADGYAGFPSCLDAPTITADAALYRDEPRYGNADALVAQVSAWASGEPGFAQLWLDRDHHGWVTVGFGPGSDVATLQGQAAARFPGEGVVVVAVPRTLAELEALGERVRVALTEAGTPTMALSPDVPRGVLQVSGVVASPEADAALRTFAGEPLCVDAVDPAQLVPEGEQADGGESWRLLGHEEGTGEPYRTDVATTDAQLAALWQESGLAGPAPEVDWHHEIVVWFGAVYGSGCPVRLDGIVVDGATLHGTLVVPGSGPQTGCNADANPHSFVVAVQRTLLPTGPFTVQLDAQAPPPGAPQERTLVDVDLSRPDAVATDAQIHRDPNAGPQPGPLVEDGYRGMPPTGARYVWNPRPQCQGTVVGPIDGSLWRLADHEAPWAESPGQELELFPINHDTIVMSSPGMDYSFVRTPDSVCTS